MTGQLIKVQVDPQGVFDRAFTELERTQLPFATLQAVNATAFGVREAWKREAPRALDRPTPLTVNAILYRKATKQRPAAEVFIRDEAFKGTPPAKYLLPQVEGGSRPAKGLERLLQAKGFLPRGMFAVPGKGVQLDAFGNVPSGQVRQIISQLGVAGEQGYASNETERTRARRKRRGGSDYFVVGRKKGNLLPGIYRRREMAAGDAARRAIGARSRIDSIFIFVRSVSYRPRYRIYEFAQREWNKLFPFHFPRELAKAVATARFRGRG